MNKKRLFFLVCIILFVILNFSLIYTTFYFKQNSNLHSSLKPADIFSNEDEYIAYIESLTIPGISFHIYQIEHGDNFWKIAKQYNVDIDTLIGANPLWENIIAKVDQRIVIPSKKGVLHFVNHIGEINELHKLYRVPQQNVLTPSLFTYILNKLHLTKAPIAVYILDARPLVENMTNQLAQQYRLREMFRSPLGGRLSSFFGGRIHPIFRQWGFHNGLDIAAPHGTLVGAARNGVVIATGWMGGYGYAVILQHDEGFKTLYGHLSAILVKEGQYVTSGQIIGKVGSTGWSTGPHLHFTLWHNGKLINPLKVLW